MEKAGRWIQEPRGLNQQDLPTTTVEPETYREEVKRDPLTEPKHERPTKTGMIQAMTPKW